MVDFSGCGGADEASDAAIDEASSNQHVSVLEKGGVREGSSLDHVPRATEACCRRVVKLRARQATGEVAVVCRTGPTVSAQHQNAPVEKPH